MVNESVLTDKDATRMMTAKNDKSNHIEGSVQSEAGFAVESLVVQSVRCSRACSYFPNSLYLLYRPYYH
uniref:Uncharacterized protein n=1 Tax=Acrobeloides nanus TaxID=290746 RepID=A0A914DFY3_9BILA